jgi:hypothetical protein
MNLRADDIFLTSANFTIPSYNTNYYTRIESDATFARSARTITINGASGTLTSNLVFTVAGGGGGAVDSVFGRTGAVIAQTGDYTASQVGAVATGDTNGWVVSPHTGFLTAETDAIALGQLTTHTNRTDNPHVVTAEQLGAVTTAMTNGWVVSAHTAFVTETITNGLASIDYVNTKFNGTLVKKAVLDGDLTAMFASTAVKKIPYMEQGAGITITRIVVQSSVADPTTELNANIHYCDEQATGAFPSTNPTLVSAIDTTTGNYDSGVVSYSVTTGKELYLLIDADPVDLNQTWTITVSYTTN